jgi:hypothetical protein
MAEVGMTPIAFHLLGESQIANCNGFRPASVSHCQAEAFLGLKNLAS